MTKIVVNTVYFICAGLLVVMAGLLFAIHTFKSQTAGEFLPLSAAVILLTYSAFAMNWARLPAGFESPEQLKTIYLASLYLFVASLLTVFTLVLMSLPGLVTLGPGASTAVFYLHVILFALAQILSVVGLVLLLRVARQRFLSS